MQHSNPVVKETSYCLAHLPDLVRHGSKPRREIAKDANVESQIVNALRSFDAAVGYPPNQVYIGELSPRELTKIPQPWFDTGKSAHSYSTAGLFGEIIPQDLFYALIKQADVLHPPLFELTRFGSELLRSAAAAHVAVNKFAVDKLAVDKNATTEFTSASDLEIEQVLANEPAIRIVSGGKLVGCFRADMRAEGYEDANLSAPHLLEALCAKASAALALHGLLKRSGIAADQIDFVISCGEEACGDRYQRGGGGMAKSIGQMCGCVNASGMDIKNFCAAPASALVTAGALVQTGLYDRIAVVAGGSLAKLGMKYQGFLRAGIPILDDCIASAAFLITRDDGHSPLLHLERGSIGLASIGSSTSDEAVYRDLILKPLRALGLNMNDIDRYAPELHNPEIMRFAGSGDVTQKNFRMIAAMAVMTGLMEKAEMPGFIERIGMPGFAPTQGHIPSAIPFLGHALEAMKTGEIRRAMFLCKASLFLNRITDLFDGVSFVLEKNPQSK